MMTKTPLQRFALAATLIAFSGHSLAQLGGGMGGGGGRRGTRPDTSASPRTGDSMSTPTPATAASKVRDKLYDLRLQLMIAPEQSAPWDRFSDIVWDMATHPSLAGAAPGDEQTVVQVVQQRTAQAQDKARRLQGLSDALSKLYEALTPEQRHVADQNLPAVIP
jgi:Spy/CpxP family protein refolding chaperone